MLNSSYNELKYFAVASEECICLMSDSEEAAKESILYSYKHGFSGFAAILNHSQAKLIAGVIYVGAL